MNAKFFTAPLWKIVVEPGDRRTVTTYTNLNWRYVRTTDTKSGALADFAVERLAPPSGRRPATWWLVVAAPLGATSMAAAEAEMAPRLRRLLLQDTPAERGDPGGVVATCAQGAGAHKVDGARDGGNTFGPGRVLQEAS